MQRYNVHSLPVWCPKLESYVGIIDHQDILRLLYKIYISIISSVATTVPEIVATLMQAKVAEVSGTT